MARAQVTVRSKTGGREYPTLTAWLDDVKADLPLVLPAVALEEYRAQVAGGNPPSNILVDGRAADPPAIATAQKRVQLFFMDVETVARAVALAWAELQRLYTRSTGKSAATIQIWGRYNIGPSIRHERISSIGAVRAWLEQHRGAGTYIRMIGPDVPYRRALYYSPPGTRSRFQAVSKISSRRLAELERAGNRARVVTTKGKRSRVQVETSDTVSAMIKRKLTGQYGRSIYFSARFIAVPVPTWAGATKARQGVPAIAIGWRRKGALFG